MAHPLYELSAQCEDLPELLPESDGGPCLALPVVEPSRIVEAVAARQAQGGRLQEKIDGCWLTMRVDDDARLCDPRSRAELELRYAHLWVGQRVDHRFVGWQLVGELEAGTTRALNRREERDELLGEVLPIYHLFALVDPDGGVHEGHELAYFLGQLAPVHLAGRLRVVREALPGEDWAAFTQRVFADGGEGVIVRQDGHCFRAKPQIDFDRYVMSVVCERDRGRNWRLKAKLGVCVSNGARPRYQYVQTVLLPVGASRVDYQRSVVTIVGSSIDLLTGVVRHARIVDLRHDKKGSECKQ